MTRDQARRRESSETAPQSRKDTRLGKLVLERGLLSREELEGAIAREEERVGSARSAAARKHRRLGEVLVAERYITATLLMELLDTQRRARALPGPEPGEGTPPPRTSAAAAADAPVIGEETEIRRPDDIARAVQGARLVDYLAHVRKHSAHELVLMPGRAPAVRIAGELVPLEEPPLEDERATLLIEDAFADDEREAVERGSAASKVLDLHVGRFRAHLAATDAGLVLTCRALSLDVGENALVLPPEVAKLALLKRGLVAIAGGRGATRASVLAQLVDLMNERTRRHVITIERQISYEHRSRLSLVTQREVGYHTHSFESALRASLREDPDVLLVGEIGEPDAIATALLAAETGHLVICSLHATDAPHAIRRLVEVQGAGTRDLVRVTLANTLQAIAVLDVLPGTEGQPILVADVVSRSPTLSRLIREDKLHQLRAAVRGVSSGILSRDDHIVRLYEAGRVSRIVALERVTDASCLAEAKGPE